MTIMVWREDVQLMGTRMSKFNGRSKRGGYILCWEKDSEEDVVGKVDEKKDVERAQWGQK